VNRPHSQKSGLPFHHRHHTGLAPARRQGANAVTF
jgi:hypothetical protein